MIEFVTLIDKMKEEFDTRIGNLEKEVQDLKEQYFL